MISAAQENGIAIVSIATGSYRQLFKECLDSQRKYAESHGFRYLCLSEAPPSGISGAEAAWLKIPVLLTLLRSGYSWVAFLDADCLVRSSCPGIETVETPGKSIYAALDRSGKINAGVLIARNSPKALSFFRNIWLTSDLPGRVLPKGCQNLYENGHVIWMARRNEAVQTIDPKWNHTSGLNLKEEHILHGVGMYSRKPRSTADKTSCVRNAVARLSRGSRFLRLKKHLAFYRKTYEF